MGGKGANVMTNGRDDFYNSLPYERINAGGVSAQPYVNMSSLDKDAQTLAMVARNNLGTYNEKNLLNAQAQSRVQGMNAYDS